MHTYNMEALKLIIEATGLKGLKSDLAHLDEVTTKLGFVRWQWEYTVLLMILKWKIKQAKPSTSCV